MRPLSFKFEHLSPKVKSEIFKYISISDKVRYERVNSSLSSCLFEAEDLEGLKNGLNSVVRRKQFSTYTRILAKCPKARTLSLDFVHQEDVLLSLLIKNTDVNSYASQLASACSNCEIICFDQNCKLLCSLLIANEILLAAKVNRIRTFKISLFSYMFQGENEPDVTITKLIELFQLCPKARKLALSLSVKGPGSKEKRREEMQIRSAFETLWIYIAKSFQVLHYAPQKTIRKIHLQSGKKEIFQRKFENLLVLKLPSHPVTNEQSILIGKNMRLLKSLEITCESMSNLEPICKLQFLEKLNFAYFGFEDRKKRHLNDDIFNRFLAISGMRWKSLSLAIPIQNATFFDNLLLFCPNLKKMPILRLSGFNSQDFPISTLNKLPPIRKLDLAKATLILSSKDIEQLLSTSLKLRHLQISLPIWQKDNLEVLLKPIKNYSTRNAKRRMKLKMDYFGNPNWISYETSMEGNLCLKIDDGKRMQI